MDKIFPIQSTTALKLHQFLLGFLVLFTSLEFFSLWQKELLLDSEIGLHPIFWLTTAACASLAGLLLVFRKKTLLASALAFLSLSLICLRNPYYYNAGDLFLRSLLLWQMLLPVTCKHNFFQSNGSLFLWLQILLAYSASFILKISGDWLQLEALQYVLNHNHFATEFAEYLIAKKIPWNFLTALVLVSELLLPWALFITRKQIFWWALVAMHVLFFLFLEIHLFSLVMICALVLIFPLRKKPEQAVEVFALNPWKKIFGFSLILFFIVLNINYLFNGPRKIHDFANLFRQNQIWNMFSPQAPKVGWWLKVNMKLQNNEIMDLTPTRAVFLERPVSTAKNLYQHPREQILFWHLHQNTVLQKKYAAWLCKNRNHAASISIYTNDILTDVGENTYKLTSTLLWQQDCITNANAPPR